MQQNTKITPELINEHGLTGDEYDKIVSILGREPNIAELGIFSVMWSEHCSYKSSKVHLKKLPTSGPRVLQGPGENAGIVDIGDGLAVVFKMESHNHPSFIEPFQGAATGVGGILRDIFTMGARPFACLSSLRFGAPSHPKTGHLLNEVVAGISAYGNRMGIPTVGGETVFDACYNGNILVNAFAAGLVRHDKIFRGHASGVGNPVIYVGSKTGRDGIHGATMASDEFSEANDHKRPAVQVGDPFTEKLLLEACMEAFETGAILGIQDMGAAGLTSSSFEMASRAGTGIRMDLKFIPLREEGMTPYEILLSESQERMLMVVKRGREGEIKNIFKKWDLSAVIVGEVTNNGRMVILSKGETVVDLPISPVTCASPVYKRPSNPFPPLPVLSEVEGKKGGEGGFSGHELQNMDLGRILVPLDMNTVLERLLSDPSLASKEWVYGQYDHMIGTDTVVLPGSDAAVMRIKGTKKGIALTVDCNGRYCYLDPYWGAAHAVYECVKNLAASGAKALAVTDCLNFGNPEKPEIMWQFEQAVLGMSEACRFFDTPVVSGNVSFYNETNGVPIYPTPTIAMIGLLDDVGRHCTQNFKEEGDVIILLGENADEMGGSSYLARLHGVVGGPLPVLDFKRAKAVVDACLIGIRRGLVRSAHDTSDGGLAFALAECCISGKEQIGATVELDNSLSPLGRGSGVRGDQPPLPLGERAGVRGSSKLRPDALLFGETAARIVVTVSLDDVGRMLAIAESMNCPAATIGLVGGKTLVINDKICMAVDKMRELWNGAFKPLTGSLTI